MKRFLACMCVMGAASIASADINDDLQRLGGAAAEGYLGPVVSTLGANLNQGWFFEAPKPELWGIDFSMRTVFVGTMFASSDKTFSANTTTKIDDQTAQLLAEQMLPSNASDAEIDAVAGQLIGKPVTMSIDGPTLIGSEDDEVTLTMASDVPVTVGGETKHINGKKVPLGVSGAGLSGITPGVPLVFPQITVGTLAGTQLSIRYLPEVEGFSFFGIGINHNPGFWTEKARLPFGINSSVNFAWSKMSYGDFLEFTAWNAGLTASRQFGWRFLNVAPFIGLGVEGSSLDVSYETSYLVDGKPLKVGFSADGDNFLRATVGSKFRLGIIDLAGSYTLAKNNSVAVNLGLGF